MVNGKGARGSGPRQREGYLFQEGRELLWWYIEEIRGEFGDDADHPRGPLWPSERKPTAIAALNLPIAPAIVPATFRKALHTAAAAYLTGPVTALRDADGHDVLPQEALNDLPRRGQAVSQILQRANLLRPRAAALPRAHFTSVKPGYSAALLPPPPRSCVDCDAWMSYTRNRCRACRSWRSSGHRLGRGNRCHRDGAALREGYCRGCRWHLSTHGPDTTAEPFTQLRLGEPLPPPARARKNPLDRSAAGLRPATFDAARAPSTRLEVPGQQVLFAMRRDWSPLVGRRTEDLPALTEPAQQLLERFAQVMRDQVAGQPPLREPADPHRDRLLAQHRRPHRRG